MWHKEYSFLSNMRFCLRFLLQVFLCAWLVYISRLNLVSDAAWWNIEKINKLNQSPIIYNWHNCMTKLTVGLHIAISQNRCTRFYSGKPVFPANSVSFTPLYFVTSLSWQFLNRTKGNWKVRNSSSSLIYQYASLNCTPGREQY